MDSKETILMRNHQRLFITHPDLHRQATSTDSTTPWIYAPFVKSSAPLSCPRNSVHRGLAEDRIPDWTPPPHTTPHWRRFPPPGQTSFCPVFTFHEILTLLSWRHFFLMLHLIVRFIWMNYNTRKKMNCFWSVVAMLSASWTRLFTNSVLERRGRCVPRCAFARCMTESWAQHATRLPLCVIKV